MKKQVTKLGFTLIELLVVITIIGILATGATAIYTSQIQKSRDSNRVTDIKALQTSIEQIYADISEYPGTENNGVQTTLSACSAWVPTYNLSCLKVMDFIADLPEDKKLGQPWANSPLVYMYNVADSDSWVNNQLYELSVGFEAKGSLAAKASNTVDNGWDNNRMEVGHPAAWISTSIDGSCAWNNTDQDSASSSCTNLDWLSSLDWSNADQEAVVVAKLP